LSRAIYWDDAAEVARLLRSGINPNQVLFDFTQGWPLLHFAVAKRRSNSIQPLLAAGAAVDGKDHNGLTPLMLAANGINEPCLRRLLAAGSSTAVADNSRWTALHWAAATAFSRSMIQALLDAGADLAAVDHGGNTPLHVAARHRKPHAFTCLVGAGANLDPVNGQGCTPRALAAMHRDILSLPINGAVGRAQPLASPPALCACISNV